MKVQQAPLPLQAALLLPETAASKTIQLRNGGSTSQRSPSVSSVSSVLETELKRLRRSQSRRRRVPLPALPMRPVMPPFEAAAARAGISAVTAGSPLHQRDVAVVPVHERRE